jgi:hypothetical protein
MPTGTKRAAKRAAPARSNKTARGGTSTGTKTARGGNSSGTQTARGGNSTHLRTMKRDIERVQVILNKLVLNMQKSENAPTRRTSAKATGGRSRQTEQRQSATA